MGTRMTVDREQIQRDVDALDDCLDNEVEVLLRKHCLALLDELERAEILAELATRLAQKFAEYLAKGKPVHRPIGKVLTLADHKTEGT